jgi:hypothetical protein
VKDWGLRRQQLTNEIDVKCGWRTDGASVYAAK